MPLRHRKNGDGSASPPSGRLPQPASHGGEPKSGSASSEINPHTWPLGPNQEFRPDPALKEGQSSKELAYPIFDRDGKVARVIKVAQGLPSPPFSEGLEKRGILSPSAEEEEDVFCGIVGRNKKMKALFQIIRLISPSDVAVLIYGESGTGKELVAKAIHRNSPRRNRPFIAIDCGSLSESLLESELFGHMKGAFTGAIQTKRGLFEEAEGGTLFLDEIGDSSLAFQAKLLRVLQEGEARPVGGNRTVRVDVRVIAATNKSLSEAIDKKTFREDLYYRLAVMPVIIPPLRERLDDIPLLSRHFIEQYAAKNGKGPMRLSEEAIKALLKAPWRGNVRELQNVIGRGVLISPGPEIFPGTFLLDEVAPFLTAAPVTPLFATAKEMAAKIERERIIEAIRNNNGNKSLAAKSLGIARASLYNKLKEFKINPPA